MHCYKNIFIHFYLKTVLNEADNIIKILLNICSIQMYFLYTKKKLKGYRARTTPFNVTIILGG